MKKPPATQMSCVRAAKVLSVSPSGDDHAALNRILQQTKPGLETTPGWIVYSANTLASARAALMRQEFPVVISEDNLLPGTWQDILDCVSHLPAPPVLIVASRLADERLWAEALNLGAWDVLAKPFDTKEVTRVMASAWRHWRVAADSTFNRNPPGPEHMPLLQDSRIGG